MNAVLIVAQVSLCHVIEPSDHSVSKHLLSPRRISGFSCVGLTVPHSCGRPFNKGRCVLGFAIGLLARHDRRPNRVHLRYGLIVHLRLLSTPPRGDAVTFSYEVPEHFGKDSHLADSMHLQAHIGIGRTDYSAPPPSKPCWRISRTRLSRKWSYLKED